MSRHRDFRNLNINDELDDDALSDGGEYELTPEDQAKLNSSLDQVRIIIGDIDQSGLSDTDLKNVLWDKYFDIRLTVQWALDEQQRRTLARERKVDARKDLPPLPQLEERTLGYGEYSPPVLHPHQTPHEQGELGERPRVPLIVLAQQQHQLQQDQGSDYEDSDSGTPRALRRNLSTITELTERTEASPHWPSKQQLVSLNTPRPPTASPSTSYGEVINSPIDPSDVPLDPNLIPVSPSGSALQRLSFYEPAPSMTSTESRSTQPSPPRPPSEPLPPIESIPDIPDYNSKSSKQAIPPTKEPPKKSKLAMLASSRASASSVKSESSKSSGTAPSGSVKTYPALRPSSQSIRPPSSVASSSAPSPSSTSSHVRRAIQTAMDLEAVDQKTATRPSQTQQTNSAASELSTPSKRSALSDRSRTLTRPSAPTPSKTAEMPSPTETQPAGRQISKLALLAQAKAEISKGPWMPKSRPLRTTPPPRASTLLDSEHTEYLMPIANGPTVTTAITTSYQSLYSLTDPSRPSMIPALSVVPLSQPGARVPSSPNETKQSKLALKIKKAHEKHHPEPAPVERKVNSPSVPPLFLPKPTRTHKDPSRKSKGKQKERTPESSGDPTSPMSDTLEDIPKHRSSRKHSVPAAPDFSPPHGFAFDVPSPDDVVFNARRGTSLAQRRDSPASPTPRSSALAGKPSTSKA